MGVAKASSNGNDGCNRYLTTTYVIISLSYTTSTCHSSEIAFFGNQITLNLNQRSADLCERMLGDSQRLRIAAHSAPCGARIIDCGITARGGLEAGLRLAEVCLAGLGTVQLAPARPGVSPAPTVQVSTDHPVAACLASQYAGWKLAQGKFFAMGSGAMRASANKEAVFAKIGHDEKSDVAVGVLEARQLPPDELCQQIVQQCGISPDRLTLLVAPTASQAGGLQVVARSVETALHKLFELGFDVARIESGFGVAPLPPVAKGDLAAIGLTNDAILYGAEVTLWVRGDDLSLEVIGPKVPSGSSSDYGQPFLAIFERYDRDFYKIDPHLFSPAVVTFRNLDTGNSYRFGQLLPSVLNWESSG